MNVGTAVAAAVPRMRICPNTQQSRNNCLQYQLHKAFCLMTAEYSLRQNLIINGKLCPIYRMCFSICPRFIMFQYRRELWTF
ncbi:hypothetical protein MPTK1_7g14130 [Marchantia polymorpha subsp. ruderalis]|uniref:Uncharacterized protein n=2 Tax=Marchantia polymorpha TaxID=3197 RepID=A0AAF6BZF5_MARPO|nr:hypothetical protein MARPO_0009s0098 [Marchantia polymorpha]BBN17389.1 hypothetical protein Mp_7g14130 [Marchantia polymorpha subsp. ruderalis]|eukprot:PTQ46994.1 hypothetical protein MARPO_0009s0098 [Marchantia polymorpha]